jgi:sugar phosphate permease
VFYGWWVLAGSVVAVALASGVSFWSFGLYVEPLEADFGWSRAEVAGGFSLSLLVSGLAGPLVGRWADVRGPRIVIFFGAVTTAASYLLLSLTSELWQWYAFLALSGLFRQFMLFIPFQALISRWFDRRRGLAVGILGIGFSMGGFVVVPLMRLVIDEAGWEASFVVAAAAIAAYFIPLSVFLLRDSPADIGDYPDGARQQYAPAAGAQPLESAGLTLGEAMRTPYFWVISLAFMFFFYGMFGMLVHLVPFYESVGISRSVAAGLVAVAAGLGMVARLTLGFFADRISRMEAGAMALIVLLWSALGILLTDSGTVGITIFLALWVVGSGGGPLLEPLILPRAFGLAHFGAILGAVGVVETMGLITSPAIAGAIYDETGSYGVVLAMFMATFVAAFLLFFTALRMRLPVHAWQEEAVAAVAR